MYTSKLPADPIALILGIISIVIGIAGCCCYGIIAVIPLIIGIIGLVTANKSLKEYALNPEAYSPQSKSNVSTGKVLSIIGIIFNAIVVLFFVFALVFYGTMLSSGVLNELKNHNDYEYNETYEWENDTLFDDSENHIDETVIDTTESEPLKKTFIEGP